MNSALTVTQLNTYVRSVLEQDFNLSDVILLGEISNFVNHYRSGHFYFSLKDESSLIKAVMFKSSASRIKFTPENGMKVLCRGRVSLYERDGQYQFYVDDMTPYGIGNLNLAFEQLKEKLDKEGLFDSGHKKPIPEFPMNIAVVTSPTGAALQDILNIISRRFPVCTVIVCPVEVQGDKAAPSMIKALDILSNQSDIDLVIIGRGGGSLEELWAYNNEALARRIFDFNIPIISAVGHETDFTICDFVSDLRAPTPSAAAELAVPEIGELYAFVNGSKSLLADLLKKTIEEKKNIFDMISKSPYLKRPEIFLSPFMQELDESSGKMQSAFSSKLVNLTNEHRVLDEKLCAFSPLGVLKRGYSIVEKNGKPISDIDDLSISDSVNLVLSNGIATAEIKEKSYEKLQ